jgi:hypothetical protein
MSRYARRISILISPRLSTMPLSVIIIFFIYLSGFLFIFLPPLNLNRALSSLTQIPQVDLTYRTLSLS